MRRTGFIDADIGKDIAELVKRSDHRTLAIWAAQCAERVLPSFESERPKDQRPREAIEACREWARTGMFSMKEVRRIALSAHAAAREISEDGSARFAARSAGHAIATAHVPTHSMATASYAAKAIWADYPKQAARKVASERDWQYRRLAELNGSQEPHQALTPAERPLRR